MCLGQNWKLHSGAAGADWREHLRNTEGNSMASQLPAPTAPCPDSPQPPDLTPVTAEPTAQLAGEQALGLSWCCRADFHMPWTASLPRPSTRAQGCEVQGISLCISPFLQPKQPCTPPRHPLKHHFVQEAERSCLLEGAGHWQKQNSKM